MKSNKRTVEKVDIDLDRSLSDPLYKQIKDAIKAKILSGEWPLHFKLPTYKKLSQELDVSIITIQQSVGALVKEGVLSRTQGVGVFVASPRPKPRGNTIALVLPDIRHSFFSHLAHIIQSHAAKSNYTTLFFSLCDSHEDSVQAAALLRQHDLSGVITSHAITDRFPIQFSEMLKSSGAVVFVDGYSPEYDCIETDNTLGVEMTINHLLELGHTQIAFAAGQLLTKGVRERMDALRTILQDKGLPFEPPQIQVSVQQNDQAGEEVAHTLFALRNMPTAIMCMNDLVARGVIRVAREYGIKCPDDISIVGFDDVDFAQHLDPPLTTIRQPIIEIGQGAVDLLLSRLSKTETEDNKPRALILKPQLIVRASTAMCSRVKRL